MATKLCRGPAPIFIANLGNFLGNSVLIPQAAGQRRTHSKKKQNNNRRDATERRARKLDHMQQSWVGDWYREHQAENPSLSSDCLEPERGIHGILMDFRDECGA